LTRARTRSPRIEQHRHITRPEFSAHRKPSACHHHQAIATRGKTNL
jgi:hypothetical protein